MKRLLEIVYNHLDETWGHGVDGLCLSLMHLRGLGYITHIEETRLNRYLKKHLPKKTFHDKRYCWKPGLIEPRLAWLKQEINKPFWKRWKIL